MAMKRPLIAVFAILACLMFAWATGAGRPYPVSAGGVIDPTCTSSSPCIEYDNNGTGPGIRGISVNGNGLAGATKNNSTSPATGREGLIGNDISTSGIYNAGVRGLSTRGSGVGGQSTSGAGVSGTSSSGVGMDGFSNSSNGVQGISNQFNASGVYGQNNSGGYGVAGRGGVGVLGDTIGGTAVRAHSNINANLFEGINFTGADTFLVDNAGNVRGHSFTADLAAATGQQLVTYAPQAAEPVIEDTGEAQLASGSAYVRLENRFASAMARGSYLVFITPEGITQGTLCVTQRTSSGFAVRENQGGRSSVPFAYRIVAKPFRSQAPRLPLLVEHAPKLMPRLHN